MMTQLALNLRLRDGSSFENFYGAANREVIESLRELVVAPSTSAVPGSVFVWGELASGKTHLLEAACRFTQARGAIAMYLSLADPEISPAVLEGVEHSFLVCFDDVQHIVGTAAWESALFVCYELARTTGTRIVVAGSGPPTHLGFRMPELATRFGWGPVYRLRALDDADKLAAMQLRARNRGFDLSTEVARYILHRYPRDLASIFALLDRIDAASLESQRRVTIPFLRRLEPTSSEN